MKKVAVILAGCGRMDGSEIHESVLTLLAINQHGAQYQCFSLDLPQNHVTNHLTNETTPETRNMLIESARIARGDVKPLEQLDIKDFDALVIPGGNGTAYNLFTLAKDGENYQVNSTVIEKCQKFTAAGKPVGFICIAPVMIPIIYQSKEVQMTIGNDSSIAKLVTAKGAEHQVCTVEEVCIDTRYKILSTPAYMLADNIGEAYRGINNLVKKMLALA